MPPPPQSTSSARFLLRRNRSLKIHRPPAPDAELPPPCKAWPKPGWSCPHAHAPPSLHYEYFLRNKFSRVGSFAGVERGKAQMRISAVYRPAQHTCQNLGCYHAGSSLLNPYWRSVVS